MNRSLARLLVGGVAGGLLLLAPRAVGEDADRRFFEGLRQHGYFEEALSDLDEVRQSGAGEPSFRDVIDYEAALTLLDLVHAGRTPTAAEKLLDQADQRLARFLAEHPGHVLAAAAKTQRAGVLVERGRLKAEQARSFDPVVRRQSIESVRALYRQAEGAFLASATQFDEILGKFPRFIDPRNAPPVEQRQQVRRDLLQARLALARVRLEIAQTYERGTAENQANLAEAAKEYADLYEKHRRELGGLYARLGQARCCKELGQPDRALVMCVDLLAVPGESEALAPLRAQATRLAMETALAPGVGKYREAMAFYEAWQRATGGGEPAGPETPAIHFFAGQAALQCARSLPGDDKDQAALRADCLRTAGQTLAALAERPGPYQSQAMALLSDPLLRGHRGKLAEPAGFAQARDRANVALERMALAESQTPAAEIAAAEQEAIKYYSLALACPAAEVSAEDRDWVRYCLAYVHYKAGHFRQSAALAEELARQDPARSQARRAANIALAACTSLFDQEAAGPQRRADGQRMDALAAFIVAHWRDEPEAELIAGRAAWLAWIAAWRGPPASRPSPPELELLLDRARQSLASGVEPVRKSATAGSKPALSPVLLASVLALAQIELCAGHPDEAVAWLEDPAIGPLKLADAQAGTMPPELAEETYRTALRAYVAAKQWPQAEAALRGLEPAGRKDAAALRQAMQGMIRSGRDLQEQLQRLRAQQRTVRVAEVQSSLERFLWQITNRPQGNGFFTLEWIAEAYVGLGAGLDRPEPAADASLPGIIPPQAVEYYRNAAEMYRRLLDESAATKRFCPSADALVAVKIRLAACLRRMGENRQAITLLAAVLKDQPELVDAQAEAAYTYQQWGAAQPGYYLLAITGSRKYREIWGWAELARRLAAAGQLGDAFCEARYNLAMCRFHLAQSAPAGAQRTALLRQAEDDLGAGGDAASHPGDKTWYDRDEALLTTIRKARG